MTNPASHTSVSLTNGGTPTTGTVRIITPVEIKQAGGGVLMGLLLPAVHKLSY